MRNMWLVEKTCSWLTVVQLGKCACVYLPSFELKIAFDNGVAGGEVYPLADTSIFKQRGLEGSDLL